MLFSPSRETLKQLQTKSFRVWKDNKNGWDERNILIKKQIPRISVVLHDDWKVNSPLPNVSRRRRCSSVCASPRVIATNGIKWNKSTWSQHLYRWKRSVEQLLSQSIDRTGVWRQFPLKRRRTRLDDAQFSLLCLVSVPRVTTFPLRKTAAPSLYIFA